MTHTLRLTRYNEGWAVSTYGYIVEPPKEEKALRIEMTPKPFLVTDGHTTAIATPEFVKLHDLNRSHMSKLNRGLIKQHKGWSKVDLTDYDVVLTLEPIS